MILAGDIGGTKTHLALFDKGKIVMQEKYHSREYAHFQDIVLDFVKKTGKKIQRACLGIAGPIRDGKCQATNLPWIVDAQGIKEIISAEAVFLLNDLEANAYGIKLLSLEEFFTLNEGMSGTLANQALISAGTGLGEAGIYWDGKNHRPFACEGGHTDFAPQNELEMELLRYLRKKWGHVSYERILSGPGLHNLYRFLIEMRLETEEEDLDQGDPAKMITERALKNSCKACVRTLKWFCSLYGSEAGNLALKMLSLGGVYIGGGIAPKILPILKGKEFMQGFVDKGRFGSLLAQIPVKIVLNENTALLGAARYAKEA